MGSTADKMAQEQTDGDRRARRNALVLAVAQALYFIGSTILITLGGLVGHMLADDKSLATLPVSTHVLGTAVATIPASLLMRRIGRRAGFQAGALLALFSSCLAVYAIYERAFWVFCAATAITGCYQAFANYYRFAAADTASDAFRPKAISWVLTGGLVAAALGPQIIIWTKDALAPVLFAGSFVASAVAGLAAIAVLSLVDLPPPSEQAQGASARPLMEILKQPRLIVAIFSGMVGYASMTFIMTATPLAMVACNHSVDSTAHAIRWHVLAMFAPSFFTGNLIARFGRAPVVLAGKALLAASGLVALTGLTLWQFNLAMVLLGLGWNLAFISATTMVTDCHRPSERNKVQAVNDFLIFGLVAIASFSSGKLLHEAGWTTVAVSYLPFVASAALLVVLTGLREKALLARRAAR